MAKLIDRNALIEALEIKDMPKTVYETGYCDSRTIAIIKIREMPTVDAEPVRHGQWDYDDVNDLDYCSECNTGMNGEFPFCPWCGAKMDGGSDNGRGKESER